MQSVLVIDSDKAFAQELCAALGARGLAPEHSEDAGGAVALAEKLRPHLIVLSVELPRANGFTVCNKLKKVDDPEIVWRLKDKAHHVGLVFRCHTPARVEELLEGYVPRIVQDFMAVLPAPSAPTS